MRKNELQEVFTDGKKKKKPVLGVRPASPGAAPRRRWTRRPSGAGRRGRAAPPPGARRRAVPLWPSRSGALLRAGPTPSPRALRPACRVPGPGSAAAALLHTVSLMMILSYLINYPWRHFT